MAECHINEWCKLASGHHGDCRSLGFARDANDDDRTDERTVLEIADELVNGDRQRDYGHPLDNFTDIADLWTVVLRKSRGGVEFLPVSAEEVALCMDLLKVSRECNTPKRDNRVDGPGYWKCLDMIVTERERRSNRG